MFGWLFRKKLVVPSERVDRFEEVAKLISQQEEDLQRKRTETHKLIVQRKEAYNSLVEQLEEIRQRAEEIAGDDNE